MQANRDARGAGRIRKSRNEGWKGRGRRIGAIAPLFMALTLFLIGGCVRSEKSLYLRHLTTVIEPSAEVPEEVVMTFDLDRKKLLRSAVAAGAPER